MLLYHWSSFLESYARDLQRHFTNLSFVLNKILLCQIILSFVPKPLCSHYASDINILSYKPEKVQGYNFISFMQRGYTLK